MLSEQQTDRWGKLKERLKDGARLPLIGLVIFTSGIVAWLGAWTIWRAASYAFDRWLAEPWGL
jgi:hypothetical protein